MLGTRPDIAFAVIRMSQYSANPSEDHLNKAMQIIRYLAGTRNYSLVYDGKSDQGLIAYTDSDWTENTSNALDMTGRSYKHRSTTGYFLKLANGAVSWSSHAQRSIAMSSTEAEFMAMSDCSRQATWLHILLGEIGYDIRQIPICGDNQGSIFMSANPITEKRSKHIDLRYYYIRDRLAEGIVEVYFIPGSENPADLLTKPLGKLKIAKFRELYGLRFHSA